MRILVKTKNFLGTSLVVHSSELLAVPHMLVRLQRVSFVFQCTKVKAEAV